LDDAARNSGSRGPPGPHIDTKTGISACATCSGGMDA
jgi:hypothetical protein